MSNCPFCLAPMTRATQSREHIVPQWTHATDGIAKNYAIHGPSANKRRMIAGTKVHALGETVFLQPQGYESRSKVDHPTHLTIIACKTCNTGWMATLEDEVKPHLLPLINGTEASVAGDSTATLIRWAVKTAIAFEQDDPASARILPAQIRDVVAARNPRWVKVYAARWADQSDVMLRHISRTLLAGPRHTRAPVAGQAGAATYLSLGHIALYIDALPWHAPRIHEESAPPHPWRLIEPGRSFELDPQLVTRHEVELLNP